jgi:hypothetical protein
MKHQKKGLKYIQTIIIEEELKNEHEEQVQIMDIYVEDLMKQLIFLQ